MGCVAFHCVSLVLGVVSMVDLVLVVLVNLARLRCHRLVGSGRKLN